MKIVLKPVERQDSYRILHGGSWLLDAEYSRVSDRNYNVPSFQLYDLGFRLARSMK